MKEFWGVIKGLAYAYLGICGFVVIVRLMIGVAAIKWGRQAVEKFLFNS
jgi:hypothetical protein